MVVGDRHAGAGTFIGVAGQVAVGAETHGRGQVEVVISDRHTSAGPFVGVAGQVAIGNGR